MSTNDKEWNEFWDNEADDDDECNDLGSDVDANNDETFDNAAEWNEDEHEELIARDSILSHSIRNNSHSSNNRQTNNNHHHNNNNNYQFNNNNNNSANDASGSSSSNYVVNLVGSVGRSGWNSVSDIESFPALGRQLDQSTSSDTRWQNTSDRLHRLQIQQQQLLAQQRLQEQEQQQKQQVRDREFLRQQQRERNYSQIAQGSPQADLGRQVLRVDELERQLLKTRIGTPNEKSGPLNPPKRTGWSPFGGKDLFTNPESPTQTQFGPTGQKVLMQSNLPQSLTLEQQQQILLQQHQILQQQHQLQQMAMLKQQQIQQEQRLMLQNPQCFTVEELEKQLIAGRSNKLPDINEKKLSNQQEELVKLSKVNDKHENHNNTHDKRTEDRHERYERYERDARDNRDHRDRREHRVNRDHRQHNRRQFTIIPPQVQLSVIDKVKLLHSITAMHTDEFLQDRMPTAKEGFLFKRHSTTLSAKSDHDGVLTEKERTWLTKIQEKIQADYDDNIDQDYYYLLYFNRFSMADEAAQKPYGSGVMDRRFIPRERLLYNSST